MPSNENTEHLPATYKSSHTKDDLIDEYPNSPKDKVALPTNDLQKENDNLLPTIMTEDQVETKGMQTFTDPKMNILKDEDMRQSKNIEIDLKVPPVAKSLYEKENIPSDKNVSLSQDKYTQNSDNQLQNPNTPISLPSSALSTKFTDAPRKTCSRKTESQTESLEEKSEVKTKNVEPVFSEETEKLENLEAKSQEIPQEYSYKYKNLPKPDLRTFPISHTPEGDSQYHKESSKLNEAYLNLANIEKDDSGEEDSPISGLKSICKEVKKNIELQLNNSKQNVSIPSSITKETSELNYESSRIQENQPKSINIMMEIAANLQHLKYQNLEKDIENEILKQSLKECQCPPNKNIEIVKPGEHMLYNCSKDKIIEEMIKLEQRISQLNTEVAHITCLKDTYKKKWLLASKEIEETEDNIVSIREITNELLNHRLKELSPQNLITRKLEIAEENVRSHELIEQKLYEDILDLKEKISAQSQEIDYLRGFYRTNSLKSPKGENILKEINDKDQLKKPETTKNACNSITSIQVLPKQDLQIEQATEKNKPHGLISNEGLKESQQISTSEIKQLSPRKNNLAPKYVHQPNSLESNIHQLTTDQCHMVNPNKCLPLKQSTAPLMYKSVLQLEIKQTANHMPSVTPPCPTLQSSNYRSNYQEVECQGKNNKHQGSKYQHERQFVNPNGHKYMRYNEEPTPGYHYQAASTLSPKYDMYNRYKINPGHPNYNSPTTTQHSQQNSSISNDQNYSASNRVSSQTESYQGNPNIKNDDSNPKPSSMPEEYDIRNRRNFSQYYEEKRTRPICPFLLKGRCPSSRCLYYHPITISFENYVHSDDRPQKETKSDESRGINHPVSNEAPECSCSSIRTRKDQSQLTDHRTNHNSKETDIPESNHPQLNIPQDPHYSNAIQLQTTEFPGHECHPVTRNSSYPENYLYIPNSKSPSKLKDSRPPHNHHATNLPESNPYYSSLSNLHPTRNQIPDSYPRQMNQLNLTEVPASNHIMYNQHPNLPQY